MEDDHADANRVAVFLERLEDYERAPRGLPGLLQKTRDAEESSTGKIFLNESFVTWFAYILVKTSAENQQTFTGKAGYRDLIADLEKTSLVHRKSLAAQLASQLQTDVKDKVGRLYEKYKMSPKPNKRRRTTENDDIRPTTSEDLPSPAATSSSIVAYRSSLDNTPQEQAPVHPSSDSSDYFVEDKHVLVNASIAETKRLFPPYLSEAIKRIPHPGNENRLAAAIAMTFPNAPVTNKLRCQMALEVTSNKVEHMAKELFGVHLETTAGLRYIYLPGGAKVLPNPNFTLRGCRHETIAATFGPETYSAITASPAYQDEVMEERDRTDCVSMVISQGASDGATVLASLGPMEGTVIKTRLYK
ncbi:hypothetical protein LTS06_009299 [Exophiala xenobiotica]|nr:hypothetical protein LTS06_009299 [Exophiala xenobiotica]